MNALEAVAAPGLLNLDEGFLALPRRLCRSPFFASLRPDERWILVQILLTARYAEGGEFWFAGTRIPLEPGQFIDSEEQIAAAAGLNRKTVRNLLVKCVTVGVITRRRVHPSGRCPFITTIVDYERIRFAGGEAGPRNGPRTGPPADNERANEGPAKGPHQNKGNPENPVNHATTGTLPLVAEADASDDRGPFAQVAEVWDRLCVPAGFAKARGTPQQRKAARARMRESEWFGAFAAACDYMAREPFYRGGSSSGWVATLGWLLKPGNAEKTAERAATQKAPPAHGAASGNRTGVASAAPAAGEEAFTGTDGGF